MSDSVEGYVIKGVGFQFLGRSRTWVRHRDRCQSKGLERAWVHLANEIADPEAFFAETVAHKLWVNGSRLLVFPARYDAEKDVTVITGNPMTYSDFCRSWTPGS